MIFSPGNNGLGKRTLITSIHSECGVITADTSLILKSRLSIYPLFFSSEKIKLEFKKRSRCLAKAVSVFLYALGQI